MKKYIHDRQKYILVKTVFLLSKKVEEKKLKTDLKASYACLCVFLLENNSSQETCLVGASAKWRDP